MGIGGSLPHLKLMPAGGVRLDSLRDWFDAGSVTLGVGTSLIRSDLVDAQDWSGLTDHTRAFVSAAQAGKQAQR